MTAAVVNSYTSFNYQNFGPPCTQTVTAVTSGNTLLVEIWVADTALPTAFSDNQSNTYTLDGTIRNRANDGERRMYRCSNITNAPTQIRCTLAATGATQFTVLEVSGLTNTSPLGQSVSATASSVSSHPVSFTTTTANELAFFTAEYATGPTSTPDTGYTLLTHDNYGYDAQYDEDVGAAGSKTATITTSGNTNSVCWVNTYKIAASGPTVSTVSSNSATEGSSIVHTVTLSAAVTGSPASYAITLAGGTATGGGTDYTSTLSNGMFSNSVTVSGGNISVPVGVSTFTVTVSTAGDTIDEANETYTLTIGGTAGTGTINDDDAAPVITVGDAPSVTAGSPAIFTITLDRAKSSAITVDAACVDGTLVGGVGYTSDLSLATYSNGVTFGAGALTIPAGVTSFTVSIPTAA